MPNMRWTIAGAIVGAVVGYLVAGPTGLILFLVLGAIAGFIADRRRGYR